MWVVCKSEVVEHEPMKSETHLHVLSKHIFNCFSNIQQNFHKLESWTSLPLHEKCTAAVVHTKTIKGNLLLKYHND